MMVAPRAQKASEAKRAQRTGGGGGYQENGNASSVMDNIECRLVALFWLR